MQKNVRVPVATASGVKSLGVTMEVEAETDMDLTLDTEGIIELIGADEPEQDVAGSEEEED